MVSNAFPDATLTLSVGGVAFSVQQSKGKIQYSKNAQGDLVMTFTDLTGTLVVNTTAASPSPTQPASSPPSNNNTNSNSNNNNNPVITPKTAHTKRKNGNKKRAAHNHNAPPMPSKNVTDSPTTTATSKKPRTDAPPPPPPPPPAIEEIKDDDDDDDCMEGVQDNDDIIVLGQPEFSQPSFTQEHSITCTTADSSKNAAAINEHDKSGGSTKVQDLVNADETSLTPLSKKDEEDPTPSCEQEDDEEEVATIGEPNDPDPVALETEAATTKSPSPPARVSIGNSPVKSPHKVQDPPSARWGHTWTPIGNDQVLVYGGQAWNAQAQLPETRKDVAIYNTKTKKWCVPFNCEGIARQWHTSTYLPERDLVISFGGEAHHGKHGKTKTTDEVMVLDTEIMLWYPPTVSGTVPSGRSGHTATLMGNDLVVIGGVHGQRWISQVSVLDTTRWTWSQPSIAGSSPKPRSYHSATALSANKIVVFGGNNAQQAFNTVHLLERQTGAAGAAATTWRWTHPTVRGRAPQARTGHAAVLMDDHHTICVYGGWDPIDDAKIGGDDVFGDAFYLDTNEWTWKKLAIPHLQPHNDDNTAGPLARVGHDACKLGKDVLLFGGRLSSGEFVGDLQVLPLNHK